jgi:hypothetical protein
MNDEQIPTINDDAPIEWPPLPPRAELDARTDWAARMFQTPAKLIAYGISLPDAPVPACITNGADPNGAAWIAYRLNRAAVLETMLENMAVGLRAALIGTPGGAVPGRELYLRLLQALAFGNAVAATQGRGATEEGEG